MTGTSASNASAMPEIKYDFAFECHSFQKDTLKLFQKVSRYSDHEISYQIALA